MLLLGKITCKVNWSIFCFCFNLNFIFLEVVNWSTVAPCNTFQFKDYYLLRGGRGSEPLAWHSNLFPSCTEPWESLSKMDAFMKNRLQITF